MLIYTHTLRCSKIQTYVARHIKNRIRLLSMICINMNYGLFMTNCVWLPAGFYDSNDNSVYSVSCKIMFITGIGTYDEARGNTRHKSVQGRCLVETAITISTVIWCTCQFFATAYSHWNAWNWRLLVAMVLQNVALSEDYMW